MKLHSVIILVVTMALVDSAEAAWRKTRVIAASEAHQAAAAKREYVYAITSRGIGKYDRKTGRRVAVSTGNAKHLNAGLFWNDRLYCAHSNYPTKPERSQIMVLDPERMRLSVFKDFGDSGGSLTWAIRRDGHWWCNFAHYGKDNHKTFLAKYDPDWKELARWTYPDSVVSQLGRYSLSGGIWRGEDLLVTGHDDPILFRLRVPESGSVLQFIDKQSAPFSGQGIANDPVTGGADRNPPGPPANCLGDARRLNCRTGVSSVNCPTCPSLEEVG